MQIYRDLLVSHTSFKLKSILAFSLPGQMGPTQSNLTRANLISTDFPGSSVTSFRITGMGPK